MAPVDPVSAEGQFYICRHQTLCCRGEGVAFTYNFFGITLHRDAAIIMDDYISLRVLTFPATHMFSTTKLRSVLHDVVWTECSFQTNAKATFYHKPPGRTFCNHAIGSISKVAFADWDIAIHLYLMIYAISWRYTSIYLIIYAPSSWQTAVK